MYSINQSILRAVVPLGLAHSDLDIIIFEHIGQRHRRLMVRRAAKLFHTVQAKLSLQLRMKYIIKRSL